MALKDAKQCTAKAKSTGEQCKNPAMIGRNVCKLHGGKTPRGIASSQFKTGRWSKYIAATATGLRERYQAFLEDPDLLSLEEDVALLRGLAAGHLNQLDSGDSSPAWVAAHKAWLKLDEGVRAGDLVKILTARDELGQIISPRYRNAVAEEQVVGYIRQIGNTADKERRLLIDRQQTITIAQFLELQTVFILDLREIVLKHCTDQETANRILADSQRAYDRITGGQPAHAIIVDNGRD